MSDILNLREQLKAYRIEGSINELVNIITCNAQVAIHLRDIMQAMSCDRINYIRIGFGETLSQAFKDAAVKGAKCRLVHIFCKPHEIMFRNLYEFIITLGEDVIFGFSPERKRNPGVKLVMIFN